MVRIVLSIFILLLTGLTSCIRDGVSKNGKDIVKPGDKLPYFEIAIADGIEVTTNDMEGKVSVIVFFHTSCNDCRLELPVLQKVYEKFIETDDLVFLAISREEGEEEVYDYWKENGLTIPFSARTDRKVYELFSTKGIPRIYIADRNTVVHYVHSDVDMPSYEELVSEIESMI